MFNQRFRTSALTKALQRGFVGFPGLRRRIGRSKP